MGVLLMVGCEKQPFYWGNTFFIIIKYVPWNWNCAKMTLQISV